MLLWSNLCCLRGLAGGDVGNVVGASSDKGVFVLSDAPADGGDDGSSPCSRAGTRSFHFSGVTIFSRLFQFVELKLFWELISHHLGLEAFLMFVLFR